MKKSPAIPPRATLPGTPHKDSVSRRVEQGALESSDARLRVDPEAVERFRALGMAAQLQLIREAVQARQSELTLAYRNVVGVATGFRRVGGGKGVGMLTDEPVLVFNVRRKWSSSRPSPQALPKYLLGHATVGDSRTLVAIPTDVQPEPDYQAAAPQAGTTGIKVTGGGASAHGTLACMLEVEAPAEAARNLLLSARHVLSFNVDQDSAPPAAGLSVVSRDERVSDRWGDTSMMGGRFDVRSGTVFDAQLAVPASPLPDALSTALAALPWNDDEPSVRDFMRLAELVEEGAVLEVAVAANSHKDFPEEVRARIGVRLSGHRQPSAPISYCVRVEGSLGYHPLQHRELLELEPLGDASTLPGDSGSAVVCWLDDSRCVLVGMHIARNESTNTCYAIPAWQLLDIANFGDTLTPGTRLRPI